MNEELKNRAMQALSDIIMNATKLKEFCVEQAPDVIQQLLAWHFYRSLFSFLLPSVILCIFVTFLLLCLKKATWDHDDPNKFYGFAVCVLGFSSCIVLIPAVMALFTELIWLQIWIAPKVFLIEYVAGLVK